MRPPRAPIMIATVPVGVAVAGTSRRAESYRWRAVAWRINEVESLKRLAVCRRGIEEADLAARRLRDHGGDIYRAEELTIRNAEAATRWRADAVRAEKAVAYSSSMRRKYEDAASCPWYSVPPDPPSPHWPDDDPCPGLFSASR
jgi:hypothetical protein